MIYVYDIHTNICMATKGKVILFENTIQAGEFIENFLLYAQRRCQAEGNIMDYMMNTPHFLMADYNENIIPKENTILFSELKP